MSGAAFDAQSLECCHGILSTLNNAKSIKPKARALSGATPRLTSSRLPPQTQGEKVESSVHPTIRHNDDFMGTVFDGRIGWERFVVSLAIISPYNRRPKYYGGCQLYELVFCWYCKAQQGQWHPNQHATYFFSRGAVIVALLPLKKGHQSTARTEEDYYTSNRI